MKKPKLFRLESQVRRTAAKYRMFDHGQSVLVAVSGGADSVALLHSLLRIGPEWDLRLSVAHLNHRLRGEESDADAESVRAVCDELGIPFHSEVAEVARQAASAKRNLEETAREVRYGFLRRRALDIGAQKIALGHTLNDQAETVLMRFLRGSGSEGLSAIHPVVDGVFVRPLLECSRYDVLNYLKTRGISFREDASNLDLAYRRNRVRHELIPYLEKHFNPRLVETLATEAELSLGVAGYLDFQAKAVSESLLIRESEVVSVPVGPLVELPPILQNMVVRQAIRECRGTLRGITARNVKDIVALCRPLHSGRRVFLPGRSTASRQFGNLVFRKSEPALEQEFSYLLPIPGRCPVPESRTEFSAEIILDPGTKPDDSADSGLFRAVLDAALLPEVLEIRSRRLGDRYGGPGHRKVKKMLIDARVPVSERSRIAVVAAGEAVIWIPGFRPARNYTAQSRSGRCVLIEARWKPK